MTLPIEYRTVPKKESVLPTEPPHKVLTPEETEHETVELEINKRRAEYGLPPVELEWVRPKEETVETG
jgi:hypothetical protein